METDKNKVVSIGYHELDELLKKDRKQSAVQMCGFLVSAMAVLTIALFLSISIQGVIANFFTR